MGGSIAYFGSNLSPALLSVGFIVGLNIAVLIFVGGAANWLVTIPIVAGMSDWPIYAAEHARAGKAMSALDYASQLWRTQDPLHRRRRHARRRPLDDLPTCESPSSAA